MSNPIAHPSHRNHHQAEFSPGWSHPNFPPSPHGLPVVLAAVVVISVSTAGHHRMASRQDGAAVSARRVEKGRRYLYNTDDSDLTKSTTCAPIAPSNAHAAADNVTGRPGRPEAEPHRCLHSAHHKNRIEGLTDEMCWLELGACTAARVGNERFITAEMARLHAAFPQRTNRILGRTPQCFRVDSRQSRKSSTVVDACAEGRVESWGRTRCNAQVSCFGMFSADNYRGAGLGSGLCKTTFPLSSFSARKTTLRNHREEKGGTRELLKRPYQDHNCLLLQRQC
ncbi:hypothetical protein N658DRAFT_48820 [Parathielavia hyrcaniae]|uniref:Uncharacterized protein n=1 Tax=Parathielavia hyrcaniae TaxID=113614 RepID=A0AAN6T1R4_9PEZI|nr:hypothetical protein N658DRAFT_48820 [Parathielavia hyrcaniae]